MKLFNNKKRDIRPDKTPLGPKRYEKVGGRSKVQNLLRERRWLIIFGGLVVVLIIVFVVIAAQQSGNGTIDDLIELKIEGPEKVSLGSDVAYDITIHNKRIGTLEGAKLLIIYPEGFSFTTADPKADNSQGTEFNIATLEKGETQIYRISGRLNGAVKEKQVIIARLLFLPENSTDLLQIESTFTTLIETAAFSFDVAAPGTSLPNNSVSFGIEIENNESEPLSNLRIRAVYPGDFDFREALPASDAEESIWNIDSLGIGEQRDFTVTGVLGGKAGDVRPFIFEAGFVDDDGNYLKQTEIEKVIKITQPAVSVTQVVNGAGEINAEGRDNLEYEITFENTGTTGLANLVLDVSFNPGVWDISTLDIRNGGALQDENVIRWDGVTVPELRNLNPRQSGEVFFKVRALESLDVDNINDKHFSTTSTPKVVIGSASVAGNPVTVKYSADISAGAATTVVGGPNPPEVGRSTTYQVTWSLSNFYNDLSGARLVGRVPVSASFVEGSTSVTVGEDLVFDPNTRQIIWNIGNVPANVGLLQSDFSATFRVFITPQPNEAATKKVFVTEQAFTAHDKWTGEDRNEPIPELQSEKIPD